jgi:hypothetical protein
MFWWDGTAWRSISRPVAPASPPSSITASTQTQPLISVAPEPRPVPWYLSNFFAALVWLLVWPIGLVLIWVKWDLSRSAKVIWTVITVCLVALGIGLFVLRFIYLPSSIAPIPGSGGMTNLELELSIENQITNSPPTGFGVSGVNSVVCNPPSTWTAGGTFTCFAYSSTGSEVGEVSVIVDPNDSNGNPQWNAQWAPAAGSG